MFSHQEAKWEFAVGSSLSLRVRLDQIGFSVVSLGDWWSRDYSALGFF